MEYCLCADRYTLLICLQRYTSVPLDARYSGVRLYKQNLAFIGGAVMKMKRHIRITAIILFVAVFSLFIVHIYRHYTSNPYDILSEQGRYGANECLLEANMGNSEYIVFYLSDNNKITATIMQKGLLRYNIQYSSDIPLANINNSDFRFGTFDRDRWIFWGVLYDVSVKEIYVEDENARILKTSYPFSICYITGDGTLQEVPNYEIVY